ncbi:MAG: hypothetical protein JWN17_226 [Frankiales bacterium]|nr:hypothetical protein [Frankiales bacterium]
MKRTLLALSLAALALTGCSQNQAGGNSNPDSQVQQPPAPDSTTNRSQGPDASAGPQPTSSDPAAQTGENGAASASANPNG